MGLTYRIVVGIDGSVDSERALRWAMGEAQRRGGTVQAVMVYDWAGTEAALLAGLGADGERARTEDVLAEVVERVRRDFPDMTVATEALRGNAGFRLADAAADADLLVVGSHGKGRLHHAVLGSVSEACVRSARCPVVVIPLPRPDEAREFAVLDQRPASENAYAIEARELADQPTAVIHGSVPVGKIGDWIGAAYREIGAYLGALRTAPAGPPFARYSLHDGSFDVEAGFPVSAKLPARDRVAASSLPGGPAAVTTYYGPYDAIGSAYNALTAWLAEHHYRANGSRWEVYYTDPQAEQDPAHRRTDVIAPYLDAGAPRDAPAAV